MRDRMTTLRTLRSKASVTVKAHCRLPDGSTQVVIPGNSHKPWREQMDEYEDHGRRTDLTWWRCISRPSAWCSTA